VLAPPRANEQLIEARSQWLSQLLAEQPEFLAMRERSLPLAGGYPFATVTHTHKKWATSCKLIGMFRTAEILARESGLVFQKSNQPWDRTDLHLLVSLAVDHHEVDEPFDEDLIAAPYREDPLSIHDEPYDAAGCVRSERSKSHIAHRNVLAEAARGHARYK
jgi:hypothetical protein